MNKYAVCRVPCARLRKTGVQTVCRASGSYCYAGAPEECCSGATVCPFSFQDRNSVSENPAVEGKSESIALLLVLLGRLVWDSARGSAVSFEIK